MSEKDDDEDEENEDEDGGGDDADSKKARCNKEANFDLIGVSRYINNNRVSEDVFCAI